MSSHVRFNDDDLDNYEVSESEDEYTEKQKQLLNKVRNKRKEYSDSEEEVYGVGSESESEASNLALSDVEGQEDDNLPDVRAWGKDKRKYYSTDYVDGDYGGFDGKDAHLAELEEQEAKNLQSQLAQQLDDDDFMLDFFSNKTKEDSAPQVEEIVKSDVSKLSERQKLELLKKESPELFGLVEDFEEKIQIAKTYLKPVLQKYKKGEIATSMAVEFVQSQYELILNYITNIYVYLLLKSSKSRIQNHPVIKRLYQYRQLLSQLQPCFDEVIKPQIENLLSETPSEPAMKQVIKKKLKLLSNMQQKPIETQKKKTVSFADEPQAKKPKLDKTAPLPIEEADESDELDNEITNMDTEQNIEEPEEEFNEDEPSKRAITYKMAKNKGLTPHRKKEQRNPRVKHKERYRKALIRRKGAVRQPRKELKKYSGEISGIKATVVKSIKIKT